MEKIQIAALVLTGRKIKAIGPYNSKNKSLSGILLVVMKQ